MKKFKKIYVEITNVCNLNCEFCPTSERTGVFMSLLQVEQVFIAIKPFADYVYLHVKGEPLLHPKIDEILDLAALHEIKVNITTTGTLLNKVGHKLLEKSALRQINFSLHSYNQNLAAFSKIPYFETIFNFANRLQLSSETIISYRLWNLHGIYQPELQQAKNKIVLSEIEKAYNLLPIEEKYNPGKGIKIRERLYLNFEPQFEWPSMQNTTESETGFCHALRTHAGILADGTVVPCCLDGEGVMNLGNIFEKPFSEIISDRRATAIYNGFSSGTAIEPLCKKCSFKEKF